MKRHLLLAGLLGAVFLSPPAEANMILSVYHGAVLVMIIALIPVMIVEVVVLALAPGLSIGQAVLVGVFANIASTLAGIPIYAGFLSGMQHVGPRWLRRIATSIVGFQDDDFADKNVEEKNEPVWLAVGSILTIFVLFFGGSVIIELVVAHGILISTGHLTTGLSESVVLANLCSYGLIAASPVIVWAITRICERWERAVHDLKNRRQKRSIRRKKRRAAARAAGTPGPSFPGRPTLSARVRKEFGRRAPPASEPADLDAAA